MCELTLIGVLTGVMLILIALGIWASADIDSQVYLKTVCRGRTDEKLVCLTFDDGPDDWMTPRVLDILKRYGVSATFFLVGEKVGRHPEIVRRMVDDGHIVANHTYTHAVTFPFGRSQKIVRDLQLCRQAVFHAVGKTPLWFRPPFGVTDPPVARAVRLFGLKTIGWSIRSLDTVSYKRRDKVCERVVKRLRPGGIILLHDRCRQADVLLEMLIKAVRRQGYDFISLQNLLDSKAYED